LACASWLHFSYSRSVADTHNILDLFVPTGSLAPPLPVHPHQSPTRIIRYGMLVLGIEARVVDQPNLIGPSYQTAGLRQRGPAREITLNFCSRKCPLWARIQVRCDRYQRGAPRVALSPGMPFVFSKWPRRRQHCAHRLRAGRTGQGECRRCRSIRNNMKG